MIETSRHEDEDFNRVRREAQDELDQFDLARPEMDADEEAFMEAKLEEFFGEGIPEERVAFAGWLVERASEIVAAECENRDLSEWELYQQRHNTLIPVSARVQRALDVLDLSGFIFDPTEEEDA